MAISTTLILTSIASAVVYGVLRGEGSFELQATTKTLAVGSLALLSAWLGGPLWLTVGLALGALGDFLLVLPNNRGFLGGLAAFLLGHLAFVLLFLASGASLDLLTVSPWRSIVALVVVAAILAATFQIVPRARGLRFPVAIYVAVIGAMVLTALALPSLLYFATIGAILFAISDFILAQEEFVLDAAAPQRRWTGPLLWALYYSAQVLIAAAFLFPLLDVN